MNMNEQDTDSRPANFVIMDEQDTDSRPTTAPEDFDLFGPSLNKEKRICMVCLDIGIVPIRTCKKQHLVCNQCFEASTCGPCPICQALSYVQLHAPVTETDFDNYIVPCKFYGEGCTKELPGSKLAKHNVECEFRQIRCTFCHAEETWLDFSEYVKHLEDIHELHIIYEASGNCAMVIGNQHFLSRNRHLENYICLDYGFRGFGNTFLFYMILNDDFLCAYVSLFGVKSEDDIPFDISISAFPLGEGQNKPEIRWTGNPVPFRSEPFKDVLEQGGGLIVPLELLKANAIDELNFHVTIKRAETPEAPEPQQQILEETTVVPTLINQF